MSKPKESSINASIIHIFESMLSTTCWIQESLKRFQQQLQGTLPLLEEFKQLEDQPLDFIGRLKALEIGITEFKRALARTVLLNGGNKAKDAQRVTSGDLKEMELAQLHDMNTQLVEITKGMETSARDIALQLEARLKDGSDRLSDYEIDAEFSFHLREDEPGFSDESENTLALRYLSIHASTDDNIKWKFTGCDWQEGYEFDPFPHGLLFHELRYRSSLRGESPPLGLRDILKVGDVWIDLAVRHQFYFDLDKGQWIKKIESGKSDGSYQKTYVQPR